MLDHGVDLLDVAKPLPSNVPAWQQGRAPELANSTLAPHAGQDAGALHHRAGRVELEMAEVRRVARPRVLRRVAVVEHQDVGLLHDLRAAQALAPEQEFRRKVRTLTGVLQLCAWLPRLLVPIRNPVWVQFVSHKLLRLLTIQQGPNEIVAAMKLKFRDGLTTQELVDAINAFEVELQKRIPEVRWSFVEPDHTDD